MRYLVTLLFVAGAMAAYIAGSVSGAAFLIVGIVLESLVWYRIFRSKKHLHASTH